MKTLTFNAFSVMSIKARKALVIEALKNKGYELDENCRRKDAAYSRALSQFQRDNGLTPNGVVCEKTFNALELNNHSR